MSNITAPAAAEEQAMVASAAGTVTTIAPRAAHHGGSSAISPADGPTHPAALDGAHGAPATARPDAADGYSLYLVRDRSRMRG